MEYHMVNKLTAEEHHARAMLMGRWYASRVHSYFNKNKTPMHIDADTLEPISNKDAGKRHKETEPVIR